MSSIFSFWSDVTQLLQLTQHKHYLHYPVIKKNKKTEKYCLVLLQYLLLGACPHHVVIILFVCVCVCALAAYKLYYCDDCTLQPPASITAALLG